MSVDSKMSLPPWRFSPPLPFSSSRCNQSIAQTVLISNTISFQTGITRRCNFEGQENPLFAGRSQLSMFFTIWVFRTGLQEDENRRNFVFVRKMVAPQSFPLAPSLVIILYFITSSVIPSMD
jgi:hypothetical protein